jgi:hypothetical protein
MDGADGLSILSGLIRLYLFLDVCGYILGTCNYGTHRNIVNCFDVIIGSSRYASSKFRPMSSSYLVTEDPRDKLVF